MIYYRQCTLINTNEDRLKIKTSWIPEEFAIRGKYLKLQGKLGTWEDGWQVELVGNRAPSDQVLENSQDYKHQRKASDI